MEQNGKSLPEITVKAVLLGIVLSMVLAAANAYLGLFAGMTVSASIPAAVVSMGILRLFRKHNILENNIVQTAASAGESLAAGVIFTLPALVIMDYWTDFNYLWVTVIAGFGGLLGVLFTIPLRRALIVDGDLKFPEGVATAEVLKSGQKGGSDIFYIVKSAIAAGLFKLGAGSGFRFWPDTGEIARRIGGSLGYVGTNLSPALLAVGYIVGLNIAVLIILGGIVNWCVAIPILAGQQDWPMYQLQSEVTRADDWTVFALEYQTVDPNMVAEEIEAVASHNAEVAEMLGKPVEAGAYARKIWSARTRYLGVGGMLIGGLWTIFSMRKSLVGGVMSGLKAYKRVGGNTPKILDRAERDIPMKWVLILIVCSVVPLFLVYEVFVAQVSVSLIMALLMLLTGFLFSAVAGYMAGLVGSSNNPISGVTIATVTISALLLVVLLGKGDENGPPAAIIIGAVVCCAAAIAGDNMQDLKAGHILGATPWKQQVMQIVGTLSAALVMAPILMLLLKAYGFAGHASAKGNPLIAAQANLMASVATGVFEGNLPWTFVGIGAAMAAAVIALDEYLVARGSQFRTPVLAVTIGIYLPLELEVPIFIGGVIHFLLKSYQKKRAMAKEAVETLDRRGLLFASGLITGEAIIGILLAVPIVLSGKPDALAIGSYQLGPWPGLFLLAGIGVWLYRIGTGQNTKESIGQ